MSEFDSYYSARIPGGHVILDGPIQRLDIPDNSTPEKQVVKPELLSSIKAIEPGSFALLKGSFMEQDLDYGTSALFNVVEGLERTRQESAHEVEFGQLILTGFHGEEHPQLAALKPFDTPKEAAHELAVARYFMKEGRHHNFHTFEPLGVVRLEDGKFGVLSKYEHSVKSLDTVFWNPEHDQNVPVLRRALGRCATVLASTHAAGWTIGDAQVKNFFTSPIDEIFIADLESVKPFTQKNGVINEQATSGAIDSDMHTLFGSLDSRREEKRDHQAAIMDIFSLIYTSITHAPQSQVPATARRTTRDIVDIYQDATYQHRDQ